MLAFIFSTGTKLLSNMNNDGNDLFSQVPTKMRHTNLKLTVKRGNMVGASRNLLLAVTRLLILADMINVHLLLKKLRGVEDDLEYLKFVSSQAELTLLCIS